MAFEEVVSLSCMQRGLRGLLGLVLAGACVSASAAPGVQVLHSFGFIDGDYPQGRILLASDGRLYGTTYSGGAGGSSGYGTLFSVTTGGVFSLLHSFDGSDGNSLYYGVIQAGNGLLYGTTPQGSVAIGPISTNYGGSFFVSDLTGHLSTLHKFMPADLNSQGYEPGAVVDGGDGNFYVSTRSGGSFNLGALLRLAPDGTVTLLHSFAPGQGNYPSGRISRLADGSLVGALRYNTTNDKGALFRWTAAGGVSLLHEFSGSDGAAPGGLLAEAGDGNLYGVTGGGGANNAGTVFRMTRSGQVTTLHAFNGVDGSGPTDGLTWGPDGLLYGLTFSGGSGNGGTIFRIGTTGGLQTLQLLDSFGGTKPVAAPVVAANGMLYGTTTQYGGAAGATGSVFAFDTTAQQPAALEMDKICYNEFNTCFRPINVSLGGRYAVTWASANLSSCIGSGAFNGAQPTAGKLDVTATRRGIFIYRLSCSGPGGNRQASVSVTVF